MKTTLGGKSNVFDRAFQWADWPHENVAGSGIQRDQRQYRTSAKSCSWYWSMDQILVARAEGRCNLGSTEESHGLLELYDDVQSLYVCGCARSVP